MPTTPQSNVERYLSVIAGHPTELPSQPASRVECYLDEIVRNGDVNRLRPLPVDVLPDTGESKYLYLVPAQGSGQNTHNEYIWIEETSKFELLGQANISVVETSLTGSSPIVVSKTESASSVAYNISHEDSGVTAGGKGDTANQTPDFGDTFKVLSATVDAKGHVALLGDHSVRIPNAVATTSKNGLMSKDDKTKLDNIIDTTLSNTGQAADAKATGDKISALRELILHMEIYCTASGNPATFSAAAANVRALSVSITPTQSGSGDPSPTNIRPITGVSSVTVTRTGENGANPQSVTVTLTDGSNPLTIYGGTLNVTEGTLTVTHTLASASKAQLLSGERRTDGRTPYYVLKKSSWPDYVYTGADAARQQQLCDIASIGNPFNASDVSLYGTNLAIVMSSRGDSAPQTPDMRVSESVLADIGDSDLINVSYPLAAPAMYSLTPAQLTTLSGYNAISSDAGAVSVTYKADVIIIPGGGT